MQDDVSDCQFPQTYYRLQMILTLVKGGPSGGTLAAIVLPALGLVSFPDPTPTAWKRDYTPPGLPMPASSILNLIHTVK